ncbi:MAG: cbb3-type cytochrome c oxidase subunit 3 [Bacteroidetes bacterium]|nr:cbb3-type cytochrome c oxidase subunit 3 [Bacteroidota bacterium]
MGKYILESAGNMNWMAIVALVICFSIFVGSSIYILTKNKKYIDKMSQLPFDDDTNYPLTNESHES